MQVAKAFLASCLVKSGEGTLPLWGILLFCSSGVVKMHHLQIQHKKKQLVESGHPLFYCFKAQHAFSNSSASL